MPAYPNRYTDVIFPRIIKAEGLKFTDDPVDHGGATCMGVTQKTYDAFRTGKKLPLQTVAKITQDEAKQLYYEMYWLPGSCPDLPANLDWVHFQAVVNSGGKQAAKLLQRALGVQDDGVIGAGTKDAALKCNPEATISKYAFFQLSFYVDCVKADPTQLKFLSGWRNRCLETLSQA